MTRHEKLLQVAQQIVNATCGFFETKGPGTGDNAANSFMDQLRKAAEKEFGEDFSERKICGENDLAVDFYFPDEATIVEVALSLRNPNSEFERDILKAVLAKRSHNHVSRLVFLAKPEACKRHKSPASQAFITWLEEDYGVKTEIHELVNQGVAG